MLEELKNRLKTNKVVHFKLFQAIAKMHRFNHDLDFCDNQAANELMEQARNKKWIENHQVNGFILSKVYEDPHLVSTVVQYENQQFLKRFEIPSVPN